MSQSSPVITASFWSTLINNLPSPSSVSRATSRGCPCPEERESVWPSPRRETRGSPPSRAAAKLATQTADRWFSNKLLFTKHLVARCGFSFYCWFGNEASCTQSWRFMGSPQSGRSCDSCVDFKHDGCIPISWDIWLLTGKTSRVTAAQELKAQQEEWWRN